MALRDAGRNAKVAVCVLGALPVLNLWRVLRGMNPEWLTAYDYPVFALAIAASGAWAFIFLFLALACTPLQRMIRMRWPGELRRTLGLLAFFYVCVHLAVYLVIGQKLRFDYALQDAIQTRSRLPGWAALILLLPLAITSTDGMVQRLGARAWKTLHWLVFPAAALAIWHLQWTQSDHQDGNFDATRTASVTFAGLMAARLLLWLRRAWGRGSC